MALAVALLLAHGAPPPRAEPAVAFSEPDPDPSFLQLELDPGRPGRLLRSRRPLLLKLSLIVGICLQSYEMQSSRRVLGICMPKNGRRRGGPERGRLLGAATQTIEDGQFPIFLASCTWCGVINFLS